MLDSEATVGAFRHSALAVELVGDVRKPPSSFMAKIHMKTRENCSFDTGEDT